MGILEGLKRTLGIGNKRNSIPHERKTQQILDLEASTIPQNQKQYYQPDDYYTAVVHPNSPFEKHIIPFHERNKTVIPSQNGLYVAEILLLEYCTYGSYPNPKNGYPVFWWFEYGIRNVGAALHSLEQRGFITFVLSETSLKGLKVAELKDLLSSNNLPVTGKKAELVTRVMENIDKSVLMSHGVEPKYALTPLGEYELNENAYVPYMHKNKKYTDFTIWDVNRILGTGDKSNYKKLIDSTHEKREREDKARYQREMQELKVRDPKMYKALHDQDVQIEAIHNAEELYSKDKDLNAYIGFWEGIWSSGGLKFEGSRWMFRLPDLYIQAKRYDDAINLCNHIKQTRNQSYWSKADSYIAIINERKQKEFRNNQ